MKENKYELTRGEWAIIRAVWDHEPCAAPTVQEALAGTIGWSYSTVKTMMDRMVGKGLLSTERIRNLILYRSTITCQEAQQGEILRTVKRAFDGALSPMMQFMLNSHELSQDELDELESLIREKKASVKQRRKK